MRARVSASDVHRFEPSILAVPLIRPAEYPGRTGKDRAFDLVHLFALLVEAGSLTAVADRVQRVSISSSTMARSSLGVTNIMSG